MTAAGQVSSRVLQIRTAEGVVFAHRLAGPVARFLALSVDLGVVMVATAFVTGVFNAIGMIVGDIGAAAGILCYFAVTLGYWMLCEGLWRGQTVGKRLFHLRVIDANGFRLRWDQVILRNLLRAVDGLPFYLVGGVMTVLTRRSQRLGDLAAGTVVVAETQSRMPDLDQMETPRYNSIREHPRLAMLVRQRISAEEASLALQAVLRRQTLDPTARVACFAEMAAHFRAHLPFPESVLVGLTDEQLVRNLVDVIFSQEQPVSAKADSPSI